MAMKNVLKIKRIFFHYKEPWMVKFFMEPLNQNQNQNELYCQVCFHIRGISFHDRSYRRIPTEWQRQNKNTDNKKNEKEQVNK